MPITNTMNAPTQMVRDFFILTEITWRDLSQVIDKVKDQGRLSRILFKYLDINVWKYNDFILKHYPDGCTLEYRKAMNTSRRVFGDVDWEVITKNLRVVKHIEDSIINK